MLLFQWSAHCVSSNNQNLNLKTYCLEACYSFSDQHSVCPQFGTDCLLMTGLFSLDYTPPSTPWLHPIPWYHLIADSQISQDQKIPFHIYFNILWVLGCYLLTLPLGTNDNDFCTSKEDQCWNVYFFLQKQTNKLCHEMVSAFSDSICNVTWWIFLSRDLSICNVTWSHLPLMILPNVFSESMAPFPNHFLNYKNGLESNFLVDTFLTETVTTKEHAGSGILFG